jgi:predicted methyltransferase
MQRLILATIALGLAVSSFADSTPFSERVTESMDGVHRSTENKARNQYRHPVETLEFFGIADGMKVMEIWPGGGWYTEILAPVMQNNGQLIVAVWDPGVEGQPKYRYDLPIQMEKTFAEHPEIYGQVETVFYSPPESDSLGMADSVDAILTFRNVHGWVLSGDAQAVFNEFARVLRPGGVLGVVQHRAADGADPAVSAELGYVSEQAVVELAANAGLKLTGSSEVNANPNDTKDYVNGVWTLPPTFQLGDTDKDKYTAIGESDRMTLRFTKVVDIP